MATNRVNRAWRLRHRPQGDIRKGDLELCEEQLPEDLSKLSGAHFLVRNIYVSIDATHRIWMSDMPQYMPPVKLGEVMRALVVGVVEQSTHSDFTVGQIVTGLGGIQDYAVVNEEQAKDWQEIDKDLIARSRASLPHFLSSLGMNGYTAYFGLLDVGKAKSGETVVVSAAAGATGSVVGQIAKIKGCRAVGIAGSDDKCAYLTGKLGFDEAINYKTDNVDEALSRLCPEKVDVYFDNVGGPILNTMLMHMKRFGRIPTCGLISQYNEKEKSAGPSNYPMIMMERLRVQGFIGFDYGSKIPDAIKELATWAGEGKLQLGQIHEVRGLENVYQAWRDMFSGSNVGKIVLKISDEPGEGTRKTSTTAQQCF